MNNRSTFDIPCSIFDIRETAIGILLLLFTLAPGSALAFCEIESECCPAEAIGSLRLTGAYLHYPEARGFFPPGDDGLLAGVTRLMVDGDLGEPAGYELNLYADLARVPEATLGGAFATVGAFRSPYRYSNLSWEIWQDGAIDGEAGVDRLHFRFTEHPFDLSVGRFPINYSVTRIFTPNDFFAPFAVTAVNKIYKPGVDALRVGIAPGTLSTIELSAVMGTDDEDRPHWGRSALLLRMSTVLLGVEGALLGGKLSERHVVGGSLQADAGPLVVRAEGHLGFPDRDGDYESGENAADRARDDLHGRVAGGVEVPFTWHNSAVGVEYAFLSDGASDPDAYLDRALTLYPDDLYFLGRHYLGLTAGGEIIPILYANVVSLFNVLDPSGLVAVTLLYSIADEAEFVGGFFVPWGEKPRAGDALAGETSIPEIRGEFGMVPYLLFMETRFTF
jgi:hypothetical protein